MQDVSGDVLRTIAGYLDPRQQALFAVTNPIIQRQIPIDRSLCCSDVNNSELIRWFERSISGGVTLWPDPVIIHHTRFSKIGNHKYSTLIIYNATLQKQADHVVGTVNLQFRTPRAYFYHGRTMGRVIFTDHQQQLGIAQRPRTPLEKLHLIKIAATNFRAKRRTTVLNTPDELRRWLQQLPPMYLDFRDTAGVLMHRLSCLDAGYPQLCLPTLLARRLAKLPPIVDELSYQITLFAMLALIDQLTQQQDVWFAMLADATMQDTGFESLAQFVTEFTNAIVMQQLIQL